MATSLIAAWTDAELIIAVYFSSRGIGYKAVARLLCKRGYRRTRHAIATKIKAIAYSYPTLRLTPRVWNLAEVDRWIDNLSLSHSEVNSLIRFNEEDAIIVDSLQSTRLLLQRLPRVNLYTCTGTYLCQ
ncbi:hypothetical protein BDV40DRAFT_306808 [Aspergillus tamarii]|uniref:Uncharacterized protein n=1 Tax=Aspergillus tamarii TaxID=41984 RepID=A0A5N6UBM5_ASPTM|nr:hypothetical protein BDV40DRAFT_306808 [Aspergillus tamarii]